MHLVYLYGETALRGIPSEAYPYVRLMEQTITFSENDEGKRVVDASGETVGRVLDVRHGMAYVDPDPDFLDTLTSKLGWGDAADESDAYPLQSTDVREVTDDEVRLKTF